MPKFARIENGTVIEVLVADKLPPFHPSVAVQWHQVQNNVGEMWRVVNGSFVPPAPPTEPSYLEKRAAEYPPAAAVISAAADVARSLLNAGQPKPESVAILDQVAAIDAKYPAA